MTVRACCPAHSRYNAECDDCREHSRLYALRRSRALARGTWDPLVEGEELERVRQHLLALMALPKVGAPQIASIAGVSYTTVYKLINEQQVFLRPSTAQALLGVDDQRALALVKHLPIAGTSRRLRAMAYDQWDAATVGGLTGYSRISISRWRVGTRYLTINMEARNRIADLYDKIQGMADPIGPDVQTGVKSRKLGYLPAERWDDDTIDDPAAEPLPLVEDTPDPIELLVQRESATRLRTPGAGSGWPRDFKRQAAQSWVQDGWRLPEVGAVLGLSTSGVEYLLNGRKDRPHTRR